MTKCDPNTLAADFLQRPWRSIAAKPQKPTLHQAYVRRSLSDMKTLTMRELNRKTAGVLDAVERVNEIEENVKC